jgi:DNA-binding response OmpR family regulator
VALIFYAEDDPIMGELVQIVLMEAGHAVGVLEDGEDALRALKRRKPDLAIVDMTMPHLSGTELVAIIRRDPTLYDIPLLVLTARRSLEDEAIARQAGANGYLRKPFEPERLVSMVNQLLEWSKTRHAAKAPPPRAV